MEYHFARIQTSVQRASPWRTTLLILGAASLIFGALPSVLGAGANSVEEKNSYKFGAFPMIAVGQMHSVFSPIAAELAKVLGRPVYFRTKPSFEEFRQQLSLETYDFAVVQPFDYVLAHDKYHYLPLARFEKPLAGSFMVLADSPLRNLTDLRGKQVAVPPVTAASTLMAKKALRNASLDIKRDLKLQYTKSHDSCLQLVMTGSVSACVSSPRAVHVFEARWGKHFRSLFVTPSIPNTLFVVHRRIPPEVREALLKTITSWPESSEAGAKFIENNGMRLVPATNAEYDVVRKFPVDAD